MSKKIISVLNNKGGTGKTTTTLNLGAALALCNNKVLIIDLDSQCNLTIATGSRQNEHHIGTLLTGGSILQQCIQKQNSFDLIASDVKLGNYEIQALSNPNRAFLLKEVLDNVDYDFILIDCAPSLSDFVINALVASTHYIIPMQGEFFTYNGLTIILDTVNQVKKNMNKDLELLGVLMSRFDMRTKFAQMVYKKMTQDKIPLFVTNIRQDINLMECAFLGQTVFDYAPESRGAQDYMELAKEVLNKTK